MRIIRIEQSEAGTFGALTVDGEAFCVTLELPDRDNQRLISCIPEGQYSCQRYRSAKYPDTFQVHGVPNRSSILFHAGNTTDDTKGCILLAQYFGKVRNPERRAVLNSGSTFKSFMERVGNIQEFTLTIEDCF